MIRNVTSFTGLATAGEQEFCYRLDKCSKDISRERKLKGQVQDKLLNLNELTLYLMQRLKLIS